MEIVGLTRWRFEAAQEANTRTKKGLEIFQACLGGFQAQ
jgi:hypothetical protein